MIKLEHISKTFGDTGDGVHAVKDVSLEIGDGEIFGIIGFSGAGKSTLVRCINLLERPTSGTVTVDGQELTALSEKELRQARKKISMIFQGFNLLMQRTCLKNVCFPMELSGVPKAQAEKKALELLDLVGLKEKASAYPAQLSGGQKQRVAIAGVIAMRPRCIVLDEPTAMLDPIGRSEVLRTIRDLNRKKGVTVVLITHHMDEAAQADRLVVMTKGRVIADGPPRQVFQDVEGLRSVGLTVPDTTQLLWELRQEGLDVPLDALSDEECAQALCQLLNAASKKGSQP